MLNKRLQNKASQLEAWVAAKQQYMNIDEQVDSLNKAQEKIKIHDNFYPEYDLSKSRLTQVQEIAKEIAALNDPKASEINDRVEKLTNNWTGLSQLADNKKADLHKKLQIQQRIEELRIDFAKHAKEYNRWATSAIDEANTHIFGETLQAVQEHKEQLTKQSAEHRSQSESKKEVLEKLWAEMHSLGITDLKYTVLTIKDIETRHSQVLDALKNREEAYEAELKRQTEVTICNRVLEIGIRDLSPCSVLITF
jgi:actinin alpha